MASQDLSGLSDTELVVAIGRWRQEALAEACRRHVGAVFDAEHGQCMDEERL